MTGERARADYAMLGLAAFVLLWDLWAILVDRRLTLGLDCHAYHPLRILAGELPWSDLVHGKSPLVELLSLLAITSVGKLPLCTRLIPVLCHVVMVGQTYDLGRRVGRSAAAGLLAALSAATFPAVVGWARLDFPDFVVVCPILGALQLMVRIERLERVGAAVALGLVLGLGLLTKLTFALYLLAPGLYFAVTRVRGRRGVRCAAAAAGVAAALAAPWALLNLGQLGRLMVQSATDSGETVLDKVLVYASLPGAAALVLAACLAAVYLWLRRRRGDRWDLGLLMAFVIGALVLLVLVFDSATRYSVALFPVAAVLVGAGFADAAARAPGSLRRAASVGLAAALLGSFVWTNLRAPLPAGVDRELGEGMVAPDQRPHDALVRSLAAARRAGDSLMIIVDHEYTQENLAVPLLVLGRRGLLPELLTLPRARELLARGERVPVLMARFRGELKLKRKLVYYYYPPEGLRNELPPAIPGMRERFVWVLEHPRRRRLSILSDGYGIHLSTHVLF
jgi:hypothetical protein